MLYQENNQTIKLILSVEDTGIGIAKDQQKLIFESFNQTEGQSPRQYGGTGLGLAITQRLTTMLGGQVELESELGKGSIFTFTFFEVPIIINPPEEINSILINDDKNLDQFVDSTILVVDDFN